MDVIFAWRASSSKFKSNPLKNYSQANQPSESEKHDKEPDLRLLQGWRREIAGHDILLCLSGETSVVVDSSSAGIKIEYNQQ